MSRPSQYVDRTQPAVDHCEANCQNCGWTYYGRSSLCRLQEAVRYHVRANNHHVDVKSLRRMTYHPKTST